jgi:hypothetical protein
VGQTDDYVNGYIPTSVPASIMDGSVMASQTSVPCLDTSSSKLGNGCDPKLDNHHYSATSGQQHSWMSQQQQPWIMAPSYYSPSPAI